MEMAYGGLLSLTQTLDNVLLTRDESRVLDEELQIKSLHQKLGIFISFLEDISEKDSESIEGLEERIRDVVYEAEDISESHISKMFLSKSESDPEVTGGFWDGVKRLFLMSQNSEEYLEKKKYEEGLKNVMEKLEFIWGEVEKMKDNSSTKGVQIENPLTGPVEAESNSEIEEVVKIKPRRSSSSKSAFTNTSDHPIAGFEDDMLRIKEVLAGSSTQLVTISIVGMGGIGKTTLARSIYEDPFVNLHFDIRAWTTVSHKYNVIALLVALLRSMGELTGEMTGKHKGKLKLNLYQRLKGKRYLVIMDDLWDINILEEFRNILPYDSRGSRIIFTT